MRLPSRRPDSPEEEQSLTATARAFHGEAPLLEESSDGVKAFVGLVGTLLATTGQLLLIDEPEAFLHPPLARKLGTHIAQISAERGGMVFAATHSPDFLMGCIESGSNVQIIRLSFKSGVAGAQFLDPETVAPLMRDPLLRSTSVLAGLFHAGVVVTEGDTDRAFYDEVNYRLVGAGRGSEATLFVRAGTKQSVPRMVQMLRSLGVPAAGIVDLDVLKDGGGEWLRVLRAAGIPKLLEEPLALTRGSVLGALKASEWEGHEEGRRPEPPDRRRPPCCSVAAGRTGEPWDIRRPRGGGRIMVARAFYRRPRDEMAGSDLREDGHRSRRRGLRRPHRCRCLGVHRSGRRLDSRPQPPGALRLSELPATGSPKWTSLLRSTTRVWLVKFSGQPHSGACGFPGRPASGPQVGFDIRPYSGRVYETLRTAALHAEPDRMEAMNPMAPERLAAFNDGILWR